MAVDPGCGVRVMRTRIKGSSEPEAKIREMSSGRIRVNGRWTTVSGAEIVGASSIVNATPALFKLIYKEDMSVSSKQNSSRLWLFTFHNPSGPRGIRRPEAKG
jgi:hypothetical protein